jgi:hypothetical protein
MKKNIDDMLYDIEYKYDYDDNTVDFTPNVIMRAVTTVDERPCGQGKTLDYSPTAVIHNGVALSVYTRIKLYKEGCVVVLPSIDSIKSYQEYFTTWIEENEPSLRLAGLYSDDELKNKYGSVQNAIHHNLNSKTNIILITRNAFIDLKATQQQRQNYQLIIDEEIKPFNECELREDRDLNIDFRWNENAKTVFDQEQVEWPRIDFSGLKGHSFDDSEKLRDLLNENWVNRVNYLSWTKFNEHISGKRRVAVIQELRPDIMWHWAGIWIACAAFDSTEMSLWMKKHQLEYKVHPKLQFEMHTTPIYLYGNYNLEWSSYKQNNQNHIRQEYQQHCDPVIADKPVLVLRNSNQTNLFKNEIPLTHNCAGLNKYRQYEYISLESALNPTPEFVSFLEHVYAEQLQGPSRQLIHTARTTYLFYQTVMRTCLREGKPAHIFALDKRTITGLSMFFNNIILQESFPDYTLVQGKTGRPQTTSLGRATTSTERGYCRRMRKQAAYAHMTNEELLALRDLEQ